MASTEQNEKSVPQVIDELKELTVSYARQETVDPLRNVGRFVGWGVGGSFVLGVGVCLLALAVLRFLQTETDGALDDGWSWAPYVITFVVLAAIAALVALKIKEKPSDGRD